MTPTVPTGPAGRTYADELRAIAACLDALGPDYPAMSAVTVYIHTPESESAAEIKAHVDDVALALLGKPGQTREMGGGVYHHTITGFRGSVQVSVFQRLPMPDPKDAEIERLRAEVAAERAAKEFAQSHLGTEGAVSQPKADTLLTEYTGRASVPDMQADLVRCEADVSGYGACGEPIYWNAAANAWWHQEAGRVFRHTATGPSVPPEGDSRWRFEETSAVPGGVAIVPNKDGGES